MRAVVADTGPLHYLVLAECIGILPMLFTAVIIPSKVHAEFLHFNAPPPVRCCAAHPPSWLAVSAASDAGRDLPSHLDDGEKAAIALALSLKADLVLMDDRAGVAVASYQSPKVLTRSGLALHVGRESVSASRQGPALPCGGWRSTYPPYAVRNRAPIKTFATWYQPLA